MAKPPEPIEEVVPEAASAVLAVVTKILEQAPQTSYERQEEKDVSGVAARQVVELKVSKVLFGAIKVGAAIKVVKPPGDYALREGSHGPFLLKTTGAEVEILGRYGPDSWQEATIQQAATRLNKT